jgi:hypothetical protein
MRKSKQENDALPTGSGRTSAYITTIAIALSLLAFAIVIGNVAAGAPPQRDENGWAHLFQLAMAAELPLFVCFLATADWRRARGSLIQLIAQLCAAGAALGALWWSGY